MKFGRRGKAILLCIVLTLVVCAGCGSQPVESETLSEEKLVDNDTQSLVYKNGSYTLRFFKDDSGSWKWKDDVTLPLDQSKVQELLDQVSALNQLTPLQNPGDITTYDLDAPDRTLDIQSSDSVGISLQIGAAAEGGGYYMCRDADSSKVFITPDALVQLMDRSIYELVQLPTVPALQLEQLLIIQAANADAEEKMAVQAEGGQWLSGSKDVSAYMADAVALLAEGNWIRSCVDYNPSAGALPVCGLDHPQETVAVNYKDSNGNNTSMTLKIGSAYGDGYYVTYNDLPAIFMVSSETAQTFLGLLQVGA